MERVLSLTTARRIFLVISMSLDWLDCWAAPAAGDCCAALAEEGTVVDHATTAPSARICTTLLAALIGIRSSPTTANVARKVLARRRSPGRVHVGVDAK